MQAAISKAKGWTNLPLQCAISRWFLHTAALKSCHPHLNIQPLARRSRKPFSHAFTTRDPGPCLKIVIEVYRNTPNLPAIPLPMDIFNVCLQTSHSLLRADLLVPSLLDFHSRAFELCHHFQQHRTLGQHQTRAQCSLSSRYSTATSFSFACR